MLQKRDAQVGRPYEVSRWGRQSQKTEEERQSEGKKEIHLQRKKQQKKNEEKNKGMIKLKVVLLFKMSEETNLEIPLLLPIL